MFQWLGETLAPVASYPQQCVSPGGYVFARREVRPGPRDAGLTSNVYSNWKGR